MAEFVTGGREDSGRGEVDVARVDNRFGVSDVVGAKASDVPVDLTVEGGREARRGKRQAPEAAAGLALEQHALG